MARKVFTGSDGFSRVNSGGGGGRGGVGGELVIGGSGSGYDGGGGTSRFCLGFAYSLSKRGIS